MARGQVPFLQVVTGGYVLVEDFCSLLAGRRLELTVIRLQSECPRLLGEYVSGKQSKKNIEDGGPKTCNQT